MSEPKYHSRHDYVRRTGKRISRGAWERLNRAYEVHIVPGKLRFVGRDEDGKLVVGPVFTLVNHRETPKVFRKVSMSNRFMKGGTRTRYLGEGAGIIK